MGDLGLSQSLVNRFNLLLEINASINSTRDIDELLTKITNVTSIVMQSDASSIALLDYASEELVFQFVHGEASDKMKTIRVPVGEGIAGWVAMYGVPLIVPDAQKDPRFNRKVDDKTAFKTKSVICVPLKRADRVIGILQSLNKKDGGVFTTDDMTIFDSLANIVAIAVENAQLYTLLNQRLSELQEAKKRNEYILEQLKQSETETVKLRDLSKKRGVFSGELEVFRVENLVQMLSNDHKTGCLFLQSAGEEARVYLKDGKLIHVELKNRKLSGFNASYEIICWQTGQFSFEDGVISERITIDKMPMSVVIEGLRRFDESNVLKNKFTDDMIPKFPFKTEIDLGVPTENDVPKIHVLKFINGKRNVLEILQTAILDRYSVLYALKELQEEMMITF